MRPTSLSTSWDSIAGIGGQTSGFTGVTSLPFTGDIDEVKVFGCALDQAQVSRDFSMNWPFP